jgi:hypothetical protein
LITNQKGELCGGFPAGGSSVWSGDGDLSLEGKPLEDPNNRSSHSHIRSATDWIGEVNYPAAELRGIKIQNLIAPVADTLYSDV